MMSSNETEGYTVCQHHQMLCDAPETGSDKQKRLCAACGKSAQRMVNMKTAVAVSKSVGKKVVIGMFLCTRCAAIPLDDEDTFYNFMHEEQRLAKLDEEGEAGGGGDESLMETDFEPGPSTTKPTVNYMEESDEDDDDPAFTLSQASNASSMTDYKIDYYKQQTEEMMGIIQRTFPDMNLPKTSFEPGLQFNRHFPHPKIWPGTWPKVISGVW